MSHKHQSSVCLCNLLVRSCSLWDASGFLSGPSLNVECIKWVGTTLPTPTEAEWDFLNLHLLTAVNNSRRKKRKHLHCWYGERLEYDGRAELPLTLILKQLLCSCILKNSCVCFFFSFSLSLEISEVASEDHGRWNSPHLQSHPRGLWELHMHADQRPAEPPDGLCQPHSDAYASVCSL